MRVIDGISIEDGSTNVYADLGRPDAEEMQRKASIAREISRVIEARSLTQQAAGALLGIDQARISRITRGQFRGISETLMLELLAKLGHDVTILIAPSRGREGKIEVRVAYARARYGRAWVPGEVETVARLRRISP